MQASKCVVVLVCPCKQANGLLSLIIFFLCIVSDHFLFSLCVLSLIIFFGRWKTIKKHVTQEDIGVDTRKLGPFFKLKLLDPFFKLPCFFFQILVITQHLSLFDY